MVAQADPHEALQPTTQTVTHRKPQILLTAFQQQRKKADRSAPAKQLLKKIETDQREAFRVWEEALAEEKYTEQDLAIVTTILHRRKKYELAVEGLLAAIRSGQAAPWMYDVLAIEMKLAGRPQKEIDRVLVSRIDFAAGNDGQMLVTASTLAGFEAFDEAIGICKELARRNPHQPELWSTARRIADLSGDLKTKVWSRTQTLENVWTADADSLHQRMALELNDLAKAVEKSDQPEQASMVREALREARERDLRIQIEWAGDGDLDLEVQEPDGSVCNRKHLVTKNHGMLVRQNDIQPKRNQKRHTEEYVCVDAISGRYTVRVKYIDGRILLGRAVVKVTQNEGTPAQKTTSKSLSGVVDKNGELTIELP